MILILVVEDADPIAEIVVDTALAMGIDCDRVGDGVEAVEAARTRLYKLILMDLGLPGLAGIDAANQIRELPPPYGDVPIVAVTGNLAPHDFDRANPGTVTAKLFKPFNRDELAAVITKFAR